MNIKISLLTHVLALVVGALLWSKLQPKPSSNQPEVSQKQEQAQECKVVTKIVTNKDGSKVESTEIVAKNTQSQEQKILQVEVKKNALFLGLATDKKASVNIVLDKWSHEVRTDLKKDHVYQLSYKVLEF